MDRDDVINKLSENKDYLDRKFGIARIGLFGSYAKGNHDTSSDLDLVIEIRKEKRLGFSDMYHLEQYLKKIFSVEHIDIVNQDYINPLVAYHMRKSVIYV